MKTLLLALLLLGALQGYGSPGLAMDRNSDGVPDQWIETGPDGRSITMDRDFDGRADHRVRMDYNQRQVYEEFDFNYDGRMDDFYFYESGRLVRQEIDSNFDDRVDVWVFLLEGIYIRYYERDTDFDGKVDVVKDFGRK
jgi:hypothetical protein